MARRPEPWNTLEQWADAVVRVRGYERWEISKSGTGIWCYPSTRYPGILKRDFWRLPRALQREVRAA